MISSPPKTETKTKINPDVNNDAALARFENAGALIGAIKSSIGDVIIGQENVVNLSLCAILGGGHALLVGMPGLAKTKLIEAIAIACGLKFSRVQFTPDLMPSDILGSEVLETDENGKRSFRFIDGPIFTQVLMADEINRASPRTQSALLQAMQEKRVAVFGKNRQLETPFHVLATQNPIEHEGAYPLPEAQLDRFLLQINVPYPDEEIEKQILIRTTSNLPETQAKGIKFNELISLQELVREMPIGDDILESALFIVRQLRPQNTNLSIVRENIEWGPGPRGGQALILAAKAHALLRGFMTPSMHDLSIVAHSALSHRIALNWQASSDISPIEIINAAIKSIGN